MKKFSYILLVSVLVGLVYFLVYNATGKPFLLKFQNPAFNKWVFTFSLIGLLLSLLLIAIYSKRRIERVSTSILFGLALIPVGLLSLFSAFDAIDVTVRGSDLSNEKIDEITIESGTFRLYVENCGATCSYNMVLNKEIDLPIGMKIVAKKWSMEHESQAILVETDSNIQIIRTQYAEMILAELPK